MALIKCPECGKEISDKAKHCIQCGYPLEDYVKEALQFENDMKECPSCHYANSVSADYCEKCGMRITPYVKQGQYNSSSNVSHKSSVSPDKPYSICPSCGNANEAGVHTCMSCGHKYTLLEYQVNTPQSIETNDEEYYRKGNLFTKVKCPKCWSLEFQVLDTKKKFSVGKAVIGNTVGSLFGPVGAVVGAATGIKGKNGKTKFVCNHCGKVWEQKV